MKPHDSSLNVPGAVINGVTLISELTNPVDMNTATYALTLLKDFIDCHVTGGEEVILRMCVPTPHCSLNRQTLVTVRITVPADSKDILAVSYRQQTLYRMETTPAICISHSDQRWTYSTLTRRWHRKTPVILTPPERETLEMARAHLTVREMAEISFRSINTIKSRIARLLSRLEVHSIREALFLCSIQGVI